MRLGDQPAEVGIAGRVLREQGDVRTVEQRDLGTGDRLETLVFR